MAGCPACLDQRSGILRDWMDRMPLTLKVGPCRTIPCVVHGAEMGHEENYPLWEKLFLHRNNSREFYNPSLSKMSCDDSYSYGSR